MTTPDTIESKPCPNCWASNVATNERCGLCGFQFPMQRTGEAKSDSVQRVVGCYVAVNQDLVDEIVRRAKASDYGLDEPEKKPDITQYQPWSYETLAHCLVSSWTAKYDLVSVFSAAMSVIQEKAANAKLCGLRD